MQSLQQKYSVCRLCLCSGVLIDIFDMNIKMDIELKDTIEDLIQCSVEREEGFPWLMCHTCEAKLIEFRLFKRRCLECKQAFDMRFKNYKPVIIAPANVLSNCSEMKNALMIGEESGGTTIEALKKGDGVMPCWLVASHNLYFKEEEDSPTVDNRMEEDSTRAQNILEPNDDVVISNIIKFNQETMNAVNVAFQEEPTVSESISIEDHADEVLHMEKMEPKNTEIEDSAPLCRIVEVGQLNADQFESRGIGFEETEEVNQSGLEHLLDEDDVPEPSIAEGSRSLAREVTSIVSEAAGNVDIKQEPVNLNEVAQTHFPVEEIARRFCCVPQCQNSQYTPGVQYVRFPKNSTLARQWLLHIGRFDLLQGGLAQYRSCVLCMDHFTPSMICPTTGKLVLGSVPTIFSATLTTESPSPVLNTICDGVAQPMPHAEKADSGTSSTKPEITCNLVRVPVLKRQISKAWSRFASSTLTKPNASGSAEQPRVKAPRKQALQTRPELGTYVSLDETEEQTPVCSKPQPSKPNVRRRNCFVPMCPNKGVYENKKRFVAVPKDSRRQMWLQAANVRDFSLRTTLYCCEDHFKMEEDIFNYHEMKYKGVNYLRPKPGVIPRFFDCLVGRTRIHHPKLQELRQRQNHKRIINGDAGNEPKLPDVPPSSTSLVSSPEVESDEDDTSFSDLDE